MSSQGFAAGSMATSAAGAYMSYRANREAAARAEAIGKYNAAVARRDADIARGASEFEQKRAVKSGKRAMGTMRARAGASGAVMDIGAPIRAEAELANELNIEQLLIAYEGASASMRLESEAKVALMGGKLQAQQYRAAATASAIKGGASLLQGFSNYQRDFG